MHESTAADRTPVPFRNVFACLVHERPECVVDLVRNLRRLDPDSHVLLYNGGPDPALLEGFPFARYGAVVHPATRPLAWGRLHDFALDCMRFAVDHFAFDTLTIVDSDQLATRPGYTRAVAGALADRPDVGMLVSSPGVKGPGSGLLPVETALAERELWRPWLRRFARGPSKFVHWSFWPATVFTRDAARDIIRLVAADRRLAALLERTTIFATEEVILPTLVALLGYELAARPFDDDYLSFRAYYTPAHLTAALTRPNVYWIHPVPREYDNPLRAAVRAAHAHYARPFASSPPPSATAAECDPPATCATSNVISRARRLGVALDEATLRVLVVAVTEGLTAAGRTGPCGMVAAGTGAADLATLLAPAARAALPGAAVFAFDPTAANLDPGSGVRLIRAEPPAVPWAYPVGLLWLDGATGYTRLARAFFHFESWVVPGGRVVVRGAAEAAAFVSELVATGHYRDAGRGENLAVVERMPG